MAPAIFGLRLWLTFVCLVNLVTIGTFYGWYVGLVNEQQSSIGHPRYVYEWDNYGMIISSVLIFIAYLYSIWGKKTLTSNKYARAVLMLIPGLILLGISLHQVRLQIKKAKFVNDHRVTDEGNFNPFSCAGYGGDLTEMCVVIQCYIFVPIITGFFVIIEVFVTLFRGPLHPAKNEY
ncbi:hypothetical protein BGZ96_010709 [Linnemannia gamsii]|uniref:Tetraspanin n=1 Tax=Linnemannia gamsii TaxID=64522 RepID=A0ABQ7JVL4_9FUNG|nr:hypothetical protein BGZ96_010709 [Linnemannia gamsii]